MSHPVDIHVGKMLRLRRKLLGLSQEAVANAVSITFQQVQKYERGVNRISASRLAEFAQVLNVPIVYFFEGLENKDEYVAGELKTAAFAEPVTTFEYEDISKPETIDLLKHYYKLSPAVRKKFIEMVKAMAIDKATVN